EAPSGWVDRVYLSSDAVLDDADALLGEQAHTAPLDPSAGDPVELSAVLPVDQSGPFFVLVRADATDAIDELNDESDNVAAAALTIGLAPYADLEVSGVTAPDQIIGDPAQIEVSWEVQNVGTGAGMTDTWTDSVIARNTVTGEETVVAQYTHAGLLA